MEKTYTASCLQGTPFMSWTEDDPKTFEELKEILLAAWSDVSEDTTPPEFNNVEELGEYFELHIEEA